MAATVKGPGLFVSQYVGDAPPFDTAGGLAGWAAGLGFLALQLPLHDARLIALDAVAESRDRAQELTGALAEHGMVLSDLAAHRFGYFLARHPAYAPLDPSGDPCAWAEDRLRAAARACANLGVTRVGCFPGSLAWPYVYPWPIRDAGLVETAFAELGRRWRPVLDAFDAVGVDLCFEPHPGCDVHDGVTFERFLAAVGNHPRCRMLYDPSHLLMQGMDPVAFLDAYAPLVGMMHVKDAEFQPTARSGVFGGFQNWAERPARFRSPGRGQVDFAAVFAALARHGYDGWAVLEWEDPLEDAAVAARRGAAFIRDHIVQVTDRAFDAGLARGLPPDAVRRALGIEGA